MKQILQNLKTGETELAEIPCPAPETGHLLIRTHASLLSAGTERMLVEFAKAGLIAKTRQQPDKVRMVLEKVKTDGLLPTITAVRRKLDQPLALGYCNVGRVVDVGGGVSHFKVGDLVVSNGKHAEFVSVPVHLCAKVPQNVAEDDAVFTVVASVALQGIRLASPTLGECFVVIGLGLIGLTAVQLLRAQGCRVLGVDFDERKLELARALGAETTAAASVEDPVLAAQTFSRQRGVDGVLITASTSSNEPVHQAAQMCRKRGRIVLVGVTGLQLSRADFYEKELSFQVSCSYGPGRYDPEYEQKGHDYPVGFVRWTEQRNFEAVLDLIAMRQVSFSSLVSHRIPLERAQEAYELLCGREPVLGIMLEYPKRDSDVLAPRERTVRLDSPVRVDSAGKPGVSFIGAGNYGNQVLIPAFAATGARLRIIASSGGVTASHAGRKYAFAEATTAPEAILQDRATDAVVIVTRHNSHARLVSEALRSGKHVFVEKPLAINARELADIGDAYAHARAATTSPILMVGFNRRFAPLVAKIRALLGGATQPRTFVMTVNAGAIPADHWTQDPDVGGGRIIGEACHFVDLLRFLADAPITDVAVASSNAAGPDSASFTLTFANGSFGTVHYLANGHKSFPKERLDVFCAGRVLQLDNFRRLTGYGWPGFRKMNLWGQDKGQSACAAAFIHAVENGGPSPISFEELRQVTSTTFEIVRQMQR